MNVWTEREDSEKGEKFARYYLVIKENENAEERKFPLADLSVMGGGIYIEKWKMYRRDKRKIIGIYFEISIMGHDLDQWAYFDIETGEKLEGFDPKAKKS